MKHFKYLILSLILIVVGATELKAKPIVTPKGYLYGFVANFTDSVVYLTDIQTVDSVWYDHKTKFLQGRSQYSGQLRSYCTEKLNQPHSTCIVIFALTRKDIEKKYLKLKKQYTIKHAGHYDVRYINENEFRFTPVLIEESEIKAEVPATKPAKKAKKRK